MFILSNHILGLNHLDHSFYNDFMALLDIGYLGFQEGDNWSSPWLKSSGFGFIIEWENYAEYSVFGELSKNDKKIK